MFIKDSAQTLKNKLTILLCIDTFGGGVKKTVLSDFLVKNSIVSFFEFEQLYLDLVDTKQIRLDGKEVAITENGIISLNFFLEKLPLDYQNTIVDLVKFEIISSKGKYVYKVDSSQIKVFELYGKKEIATFTYNKDRFRSEEEIENHFKNFIESIAK